MDEDKKKCSVCGKDATHWTRDLEEIPPVDGWRRFKSGLAVPYCSEHQIGSKVYCLDGSIE